MANYLNSNTFSVDSTNKYTTSQQTQQNIFVPQLVNKNQESLTLTKSEFVQEYSNSSKGKYFNTIRKAFVSSNSSQSGQGDLTFDLKDDNLTCSEHSCVKNIFLVQDYTHIDTRFKKYSRICINCESNLKEKEGGPVHTALYDLIIRQNKAKIREIREEKIRFGGISELQVQHCDKFYDDVIGGLSDEMLGLCEMFETEILTRFCDSGNSEELEKLKKFINQMKLDAKGDPILDGIGRDKEREREYISLAMFLIYFQGLVAQKVSYEGITQSLRNYLVKIISYRKAFVKRSTEWLRFLVGDFYDYLFTVEGLEIDNSFRSSLNIEYVSEEDLAKLKLYYEQIINQKNQNIEQISRTSKEQLALIDELRRTIAQNKIDYENSLRNKLDNLRTEYENQISTLNIEIKNIKFMLSESEGRFQSEIRSISLERDQLKQQINSIMQERENFKQQTSVLSQKLEVTLREWDNLKSAHSNLLIQFNQLKGEYSNIQIQIDSLKNENQGLQMKINNLNSLVINVTKERDQFSSQTLLIRGEVDRFKSQISIVTNVKITLEEQISEYKRRYEELAIEFNKIRDEVNIKNTILQKMELSLRQAETNILNNNNQINLYVQQNDSHKTTIINLNNQLEEFRMKINIITEKDNEISKLKLAISQCKSEWERLSQAYESLLVDIRNQLEMNQNLTMVVLDIQSKIEKHNTNIGGFDVSIKQQIDILTQQAFTKQKIEVQSNAETVRKCQGQIEEIRNKVGKIESQRLYKSAVFTNINNNMDVYQTNENNVEMKFSSGKVNYGVSSVDYESNKNYNQYSSSIRLDAGNADEYNNFVQHASKSTYIYTNQIEN